MGHGRALPRIGIVPPPAPCACDRWPPWTDAGCRVHGVLTDGGRDCGESDSRGGSMNAAPLLNPQQPTHKDAAEWRGDSSFSGPICGRVVAGM